MTRTATQFSPPPPHSLEEISGKEQVPEQVARFREDYRREFLGGRYTGWGHFAFTSGVSLAAIGFALGRALGSEARWSG